MRDEHPDGVLDNVVSLEKFRRRAPKASPALPGCIRIAEDGLGDVDYGMEGITAVNALPLLMPMLYLSSRILDLYMGKS